MLSTMTRSCTLYIPAQLPSARSPDQVQYLFLSSLSHSQMRTLRNGSRYKFTALCDMVIVFHQLIKQQNHNKQSQHEAYTFFCQSCWNSKAFSLRQPRSGPSPGQTATRTSSRCWKENAPAPVTKVLRRRNHFRCRCSTLTCMGDFGKRWELSKGLTAKR